MRTLVSRSLRVLLQRRRARLAWVRATWAGALVLTLAGCQGVQVKPEAPLPPRLDCAQPNTGPVQVPPYFVWEFPDYVAKVLGLLIEERRLRRLEQDCIAEHKARGVIR